MLDFIEQGEYFYHCEIFKHHLVTGVQELILKGSAEDREYYQNVSFGPDDAESEDWSQLRWFKKESISFADKEPEQFFAHIKDVINRETRGEHILSHGDNWEVYVLYENNHWWLKEKILTRLEIYINRHAYIKQKDGFVEELLRK